ncbi:MAG: coproporphyrinogen dehydrogenase HemZ [Lachnospiraceae bacterium]|nr:coproporphyrinogen dehydrogenase HemZ [Lachnospiraceae bacterium]
MIRAELNRKNFEYDVHSLVKAFYPGEDVQVCYIEDLSGAACADPSQDSGTEKRTQHGASEADRGFTVQHNETERAADVHMVPECVRILFSGDMEAEGQEPDRRASICVRILPDGRRAAQEETAEYEMSLDRKEVKNVLKRLLYRVLRDYSGQTLPWGNLTGIRPTKIPMALLEAGWKNTEIAQYMRETYYTSNEKTALAIAIANRERHILKDINYKNGYSLYVGIPFCPSICLYCSFSSSPLHLWRDRVDDYLDALCREIDYASEAFAGKELNTVYIGGGTPTTLEPYQLERLLTKLEQCFDYSRLLEFTVEAGRPDSITREKLEVLRAHGISRISINPQTMNQKTLDLIGRKHTVEETKEAFHLARSLGFDNINMDLIVGLPGEEKPEVEHTMQELRLLDPDSITVHSLAIKRAARLRMFRDEYKEMTFTNNSEIMDMTAHYAREAGHSPYYLYRQKNMAGNFENVGYVKEGKAGIYNILIMEEVQSILALGAGASTKMVWAKDRIERIENVKDIRNYIERIDEMIERKRSGMHE